MHDGTRSAMSLCMFLLELRYILYWKKSDCTVRGILLKGLLDYTACWH